MLAPWFYLAGVASPLTRIFDVTERQRADFAASFVMFAVLLLALFVGYRSGDVAMGILALGIGGAAGRVFQIGWLLRIAGAPVRPVLGPYLRYGLYALPGLTLAVLAQPSGSEGLVFGAVVAGYGLYGLLVAGEEWRQRGRIS